MPFALRHTVIACVALAPATLAARPQQPAQQIIQVGALNVPTDVLTPDGQWATLIPALSTPDLDFFIQDPSTEQWLSRNATRFIDLGQYTITLVSFYKTRRPCREDQIRAGFSDAAHLDACNNYRYAVREIAVNAPQNALTLLYTAMVFTGGTLDPSSIRREDRTRGFNELTPESQKAVSDVTQLVARQAHAWDVRHRNLP